MSKLDAADLFDPLTVRQMLVDFGTAALSELMERFAGDIAKVEVELMKHEAEADVEELKRIAHTVKGTAAMYGARRLAMEASMLNELCTAESLSSVHAQVKFLRFVCRETIIHCTNYHRAA